jgi:hypothetical protein
VWSFCSNSNTSLVHGGSSGNRDKRGGPLCNGPQGLRRIWIKLTEARPRGRPARGLTLAQKEARRRLGLGYLIGVFAKGFSRASRFGGSERTPVRAATSQRQWKQAIGSFMAHRPRIKRGATHRRGTGPCECGSSSLGSLSEGGAAGLASRRCSGTAHHGELGPSPLVGDQVDFWRHRSTPCRQVVVRCILRRCGRLPKRLGSGLLRRLVVLTAGIMS